MRHKCEGAKICKGCTIEFSNKLWGDCEDDLERAEFLSSGRAWCTGIIAASIADEVASAFLYRYQTEKLKEEIFPKNV